MKIGKRNTKNTKNTATYRFFQASDSRFLRESHALQRLQSFGIRDERCSGGSRSISLVQSERIIEVWVSRVFAEPGKCSFQSRVGGCMNSAFAGIHREAHIH